MSHGKLRWHRTLNCENLEDRRLLAGDLAQGDVVVDAVLTDDVVMAAGQDDPPETQTRARTAADQADGAQERPGRSWDDPAAAVATVATSLASVDVVIAAEQDDPPETQTRARTAADQADGAQERPGRSW